MSSPLFYIQKVRPCFLSMPEEVWVVTDAKTTRVVGIFDTLNKAQHAVSVCEQLTTDPWMG